MAYHGRVHKLLPFKMLYTVLPFIAKSLQDKDVQLHFEFECCKDRVQRLLQEILANGMRDVANLLECVVCLDGCLSTLYVKKMRLTTPTYLFLLASSIAAILSIFVATYVLWKMLYSNLIVSLWSSVPMRKFSCSTIYSHTYGSFMVGKYLFHEFCHKRVVRRHRLCFFGFFVILDLQNLGKLNDM